MLMTDRPTTANLEARIEAAGYTPSSLAAAIGMGIKRQNVEHWLKVDRVPERHAAAVEALLGVPRWELFPGTWYRVWPELIGADGAPPVAAEEGANAG